MSKLDLPPGFPMQPDSPLDNNHHPESAAESHQSEEMQQLLSLFADANTPELAETLEDELFFNSDTEEFLEANHTDLVESLKTTITQLEKALTESEAQLQAQIQHSQCSNTLIAQQTEELNETQQQIAYFVDTLESCQEDAQHQQFQIETLTEQLIASQEQTAHLERECALLKEECQEKTQKLFTAEKHIRELISRLQRQQRYTLQYKATLEQYLGSSTPQAETQELSTVNPATVSSPVTTIKPWSIQQDDSILVPNQELNSLENAPQETDSPLKTTTELELTSEQVYSPKEETEVVSEIPVIVNTASLPEETTEAETIPPVDNSQPIVHEIQKPNFMPSLISRKRKSQRTVELPTFLRNRSS